MGTASTNLRHSLHNSALKVTVIDHCNSIYECQKALSKGYHDCWFPDLTTNFTNFNFFATSSKTIFAIICSVMYLYSLLFYLIGKCQFDFY